MNDWGLVVFLFVIAMIWSIIWKGVALWKSARYGQKVWFVVMLIVNTVGVLEIIYLAFFQKRPVRPIMRSSRPVAAPAPKRIVRKKR